MFVDMIRKTIPRSWQALVLLIVMTVCLQQAFTGLQSLVTPGAGLGAWGAIKFVGSLVIGIAATVGFYYYQAQSEHRPEGVNQLDVLNNYQEAQKKEAALHHTATPVFSSQDGEIKPPKPPAIDTTNKST